MSNKPFWTPPVPEPPPEEKPADEPFLSRWSRLKSDEAARRREVPEPVPEPQPEEAAPAEEADQAAAEPPGEDELPPLEALDENSDYSAFMSPKVSGALRKQALRKLFRSQKFNYICELDDYIDDFTSFPALGDIVTADMKHAAEMLLKKQLEAAESEGQATVAATAGDEAAAEPGAVAAADAAQAGTPAEEAGEEPAAEPDSNEEQQRDA